MNEGAYIQDPEALHVVKSLLSNLGRIATEQTASKATDKQISDHPSGKKPNGPCQVFWISLDSQNLYTTLAKERERGPMMNDIGFPTILAR